MNLNEKVELILATIKKNREKLLNVLQEIETFETAFDEIERTVRCFKNIEKQKRFLEAGKVKSISSFLPLNQPLYSLTLFVLIPSFMSDFFFARPPVSLRGVYKTLLNFFFPFTHEIELLPLSRDAFLERYAKKSNVIVFTGEYSNAMKICRTLPQETLFLFNGGALNPIVVTESADLNKAVSDTVRERLFNSGQDCMAPCAIFIHRNIKDVFLKNVINRLELCHIGQNQDPRSNVGQMLEYKSVLEAEALFIKYKSKIVYGGKVDKTKKQILPTVLLFDKPEEMPQNLIFAPIFFISIYTEIKDIEHFLGKQKSQQMAAYISLYSKYQEWDVKKFGLHLLNNTSLFEYEDGNREFGGCGLHSSFYLYNGIIKAKPLLISREIAITFFSKACQ